MKNVLSDSQKFKLANWLAENKDKGFSRASAAWTASRELAFDVTYSNMQSAENTTGISLVKVPEAKVNDLNTLQGDVELIKSSLLSLIEIVMGTIGQRNSDGLADIANAIQVNYIKPSTPKPFICHKHG